MSTITADTPGTATVARAERREPAPIPFTRLLSVELRKSFDTRAGFWLMSSIGIAALLATGAVLLWAPDSELTYSTFAAAIGFPMAIILPMVAVLSVTSEWSQRSGLTSFTLVPNRSKVIAAKAGVTVGISVVSMLMAMAIGVIGTLAGSAILGISPVWDAGFVDLANIVLAQVLGMLVGFMLGVVIRNSSAAIVAYFVYSFALTAITEVLASTQDWFANLQPWVDFNYAQGSLFNGSLNAEQWANLGVTSVVWLVAPLTFGLWSLMRSEVK
ncbi:ABC transporter permease [Aeromicrobium ginsengisoli]|uniref:ABC transporter permease subunit n=1 Tax=Aeromicrobium ginsengisoli TaxID=363867 RepID=A0A5M4FER7_9ACTN|nr:ABC transporter permease [Aeromicrobium ginsengisoli]KAA1397616.1 ABC transporter permease subunit [Aeromicrobium ginsengisoli]